MKITNYEAHILYTFINSPIETRESITRMLEIIFTSNDEDEYYMALDTITYLLNTELEKI
jgi:hypothetical protein